MDEFIGTYQELLYAFKARLKEINYDFEVKRQNHGFYIVDAGGCLYNLFSKLFSLIINEVNPAMIRIHKEPIMLDFPSIKIEAPKDTRWSMRFIRNRFNIDKKRGYYNIIFAYPIPIQPENEKCSYETIQKEIKAGDSVYHQIIMHRIHDSCNFLYWDNESSEWKKLTNEIDPWIFADCQCKHENQCAQFEEFEAKLQQLRNT